MEYDVFGIGNALMDFLIEVDHEKLEELDFKPGQFHSVNEEESKRLLKMFENQNFRTSPAGSVANTIRGIAMFGGNAVFCGKVGKDNHGNMFEEELIQKKIKAKLSRSEKITGHVITFITPDGERTFVGYLGATSDIEKSDIFLDDLKKSKILHIEGFMLEDKEKIEAAIHAMQFAKENNVKISIDLNDSGIIERNKDFIREIVEKYADIVFANEDEAKALTGFSALDALNQIAKLSEIAVVKIGLGGSLIKKGNLIEKIPKYEANTLDMTGAGDMYAAAFLYGLTRNLNLKTCGHLGSYFAAKVVEQIGARLESIDKNEVEEFIEKIN